jgi:hypothetical protein
MLKLNIYVVGKAAYHLLEWGAGAGQSSHTSGRKNTPGGDPCRIHQGNSPNFALQKLVSKLDANAEAATVLGSIPTSSDTVESERLQMKQC